MGFSRCFSVFGVMAKARHGRVQHKQWEVNASEQHASKSSQSLD